MGYDASVYVIYATTVKNAEEFTLMYLQQHPEVVAAGNEAGMDMDDMDEAIEFIENWEDNVTYDGYRSLCDSKNMYICSFVHEHSVLRTQDPAKKLVLPSDQENKPFVYWCKKYSLPEPYLMTIVVDG